MALSDSAMSVGVAGSALDKDARETGRKIAEAAMKKAGKNLCTFIFLYGCFTKRRRRLLKRN